MTVMASYTTYQIAPLLLHCRSSGPTRNINRLGHVSAVLTQISLPRADRQESVTYLERLELRVL